MGAMMPFDGPRGNDDRLERLARARALIDTKEFWAQGVIERPFARAESGGFVVVSTARCMLAALAAAKALDFVDVIIAAARKVTPGMNWMRVESFNDHPTTTHAMVMRAFDIARDDLLAGRPSRVMARVTETRDGEVFSYVEPEHMAPPGFFSQLFAPLLRGRSASSGVVLKEMVRAGAKPIEAGCAVWGTGDDGLKSILCAVQR